MRPFLSIVTRTYRRPTLLANCIESLKAQTDQDFEHIIIRDDIGIGIAETYRRLRNQDVNGEYVWVLDDDNVVVEPTFIRQLKMQADFGYLILEGMVSDRVLPDTDEPQLAHIDMMNIVVCRVVWEDHKKDFGARYEGDWDFIYAVTSNGLWGGKKLPGVMAKTQKISHGQPEGNIPA